MPEAKRTLVKSVPELWAELTDAGALAGHLGPFGAVRITRTTPETLVEWEGDLASGTVRLEPAGFGTRVILTSELQAVEPEPEPDPEPEPEPEPELVKRGWFARWFRRAQQPAPAPEPPEPAPEPEAEAEPERPDETSAQLVLEECLEALGSARHRPFSRT